MKFFSGVDENVSVECVRRVLRAANFKYCHSRKKGVLTPDDLKLRVEFALRVRARLSPTIWTKGIAFYLDGTGFTHKTNPFDQALAPRTMAWRKASDGLNFGMTAKGSHAGSGGVILAEQYEGQLNGEKFSDFVQERFPATFEASANPRGKLRQGQGKPTELLNRCYR